jgi:hypothetical protein
VHHVSSLDEYTNAENDEACAKLWSIYVREAERYDKGVVESWKDDMEGMLIFVRVGHLQLMVFADNSSVWPLLCESNRFPDRKL